MITFGRTDIEIGRAPFPAQYDRQIKYLDKIQKELAEEFKEYYDVLRLNIYDLDVLAKCDQAMKTFHDGFDLNVRRSDKNLNALLLTLKN